MNPLILISAAIIVSSFFSSNPASSQHNTKLTLAFHFACSFAFLFHSLCLVAAICGKFGDRLTFGTFGFGYDEGDTFGLLKEMAATATLSGSKGVYESGLDSKKMRLALHTMTSSLASTRTALSSGNCFSCSSPSCSSFFIFQACYPLTLLDSIQINLVLLSFALLLLASSSYLYLSRFYFSLSLSWAFNAPSFERTAEDRACWFGEGYYRCF
jgi:hypothetical protein